MPVGQSRQNKRLFVSPVSANDVCQIMTEICSFLLIFVPIFMRCVGLMLSVAPHTYCPLPLYIDFTVLGLEIYLRNLNSVKGLGKVD